MVGAMVVSFKELRHAKGDFLADTCKIWIVGEELIHLSNYGQNVKASFRGIKRKLLGNWGQFPRMIDAGSTLGEALKGKESFEGRTIVGAVGEATLVTDPQRWTPQMTFSQNGHRQTRSNLVTSIRRPCAPKVFFRTHVGRDWGRISHYTAL